MATFNELYRKYVGPLPSDDDDDGMEEALYPVSKTEELEEEQGMEIEM